MKNVTLAFLLGLALGLGTDYALTIYAGDIPAWEWVFDPVDSEVDDNKPAPTWHYEPSRHSRLA